MFFWSFTLQRSHYFWNFYRRWYVCVSAFLLYNHEYHKNVFLKVENMLEMAVWVLNMPARSEERRNSTQAETRTAKLFRDIARIHLAERAISWILSIWQINMDIRNVLVSKWLDFVIILSSLQTTERVLVMSSWILSVLDLNPKAAASFDSHDDHGGCITLNNPILEKTIKILFWPLF